MRVIGLLLLVLTSAAPHAIAAAPAAIELQATTGFANTFNPAHWTPLLVTVSNHGPDMSGYLEVRTRAGDEFRGNMVDITHRRRLELTRDSRKRMHFTVRLPNVAHPLVIRVVADGRELAGKRIDLRTLFTPGRFVVVLSRDANLDYLNEGDGPSAENARRVLYPHPELLPDNWHGYDAVSAVVLHGVSLDQLSARQYEALRKWLASGGTLAVSGGTDYAWLRTPRMTSLLPASPTGIAAVRDPASVREVFGRPLEVDAPFHVNQLSAVRGRTIVRAGNLPLVVESVFGHGRVLFLTFDIARAPFDRWPGMQQTWLELLGLEAEPAPQPRGDEPPNPVPQLVALQGANFPSHSTLLLFVALYLSVLATGYRFTRASGALRRALPLATWAAPLLFAPAAYLLFGTVLFNRGESVATIAIIEPLGNSTYAHVQLDVGLYSIRNAALDGEGAMQLSYAGLEPALQAPPGAPATDAERAPAHWILDADTPRALTPDDARRYALHLLEGDDIIDFDLQVEIDLVARGDGAGIGPKLDSTPRVNIHNNSGRALQDAWLIADDRAWLIGAVAAQGLTRYEVRSEGFALNSRNAEWWDRLEQHPQASARSVLMLKALLARKDNTTVDEHHVAYPGRGKALLIAGTTHPLLPGGNSARWQYTTRTLVLLPLPAKLLVKDESTVTDL